MYMSMEMFRTKDTPEKECLSALFLIVIIAAGLAVTVTEKVRGSIHGLF